MCKDAMDCRKWRKLIKDVVYNSQKKDRDKRIKGPLINGLLLLLLITATVAVTTDVRACRYTCLPI